jgi:hypothetical protein
MILCFSGFKDPSKSIARELLDVGFEETQNTESHYYGAYFFQDHDNLPRLFISLFSSVISVSNCVSGKSGRHNGHMYDSHLLEFLLPE